MPNQKPDPEQNLFWEFVLLMAVVVVVMWVLDTFVY